MTTKFQVGKTYKTRHGKDVRIVATDRRTLTYPILGLIDLGGEEATISFMVDGRYNSTGSNPEFDLVNIEERWLNLYTPEATMFSTRHVTKELADRSARVGSIPPALAQVKVTYTDGKPTSVELVPVAE